MIGESITPALTPVEWKTEHLVVQAKRYGEPGMPSEDCGAAEIKAGPDYLYVTEHEHDRWAVIDTAEQRHALAALALRDQPFGFSREDVEIIRRAARFVDEYHEEDAIAVNHVADRIAALLPPESP